MWWLSSVWTWIKTSASCQSNNGPNLAKRVIWFPSNALLKEWIWEKQIKIAIKIPTSPIFVVRKALIDAKQDFSSLSGSSVIGNLSLIKWNDVIYTETGPILFTHWWISGPAVFNASIFMEKAPTVVNYKIRLKVSSKEITKRLLSFLWFHMNKLKEYVISSEIINVRWLNEAKVCWWWVKTKNLCSYFECDNVPWLYFIWECLDVAWKTWWFNLQWCWTSAAVCANGINMKK